MVDEIGWKSRVVWCCDNANVKCKIFGVELEHLAVFTPLLQYKEVCMNEGGINHDKISSPNVLRDSSQCSEYRTRIISADHLGRLNKKGIAADDKGVNEGINHCFSTDSVAK